MNEYLSSIFRRWRHLSPQKVSKNLNFLHSAITQNAVVWEHETRLCNN
jgi:hypothetical protein